jgi:hypothetical protein
MRLLLVAASVIALAACGEQAAEEVAPATPPVNVAPAPAEITDANELTLAQISGRLVGIFRSTQDELSTLNITSDGKWTMSYEGEPDTVAAWRLFAGDAVPEGVTGEFTPASRYLEVKDADMTLYYEMGHIDEDGFDMFYTARGNMLSYARVKAPA